MSREVLILREPEIRALLDPQACITAMEQAFGAYSTGQAQLPGVIHLDIPESDVFEKRGEIHVKAGYLNARSSSTMDLSPTSEPGPQARSQRNIWRGRTLPQSR